MRVNAGLPTPHIFTNLLMSKAFIHILANSAFIVGSLLVCYSEVECPEINLENSVKRGLYVTQQKIECLELS